RTQICNPRKLPFRAAAEAEERPLKSRLPKKVWPSRLASLELRWRDRGRAALVDFFGSGSITNFAVSTSTQPPSRAKGVAGVGDDDVAAVDEVLRHERAHARRGDRIECAADDQ